MSNFNMLLDIQTPAYVADLAKVKANMSVAQRVRREAGCKVVLATKAFSMPSCFPYMKPYLDGTTASGLYEARLGAENFGKEVHVYSPAFDAESLAECLTYASHVYFNSVSQLQRFGQQARDASVQVGLRVNPGLSLVKNSALYDPSSEGSRFGVQPAELTAEVLAQVDGLHIHNLCENMAQDSVKLIEHVSGKLADALAQVSHVNFGGGHYMTHPDYDVDALIEAIKVFQAKHDVQVTLEPGGAMVYDAGYLVGRVIDVFDNQYAQAILDVSASTHMPDVLEVPYRPNIVGSGEEGEKAHTYRLGGNSCMTGDVIGMYSFDAPLKPGDVLIFTDMMQYSMVKNTNFNGVPLPDLALLHEDGRYEVVKRFGYEDFIARL